MDTRLVEIAAKALKISTEEALKHSKKIQDVDAYYFWKPVRGGGAVIVATNGEKLGATSAVSFDRHLNAFMAGKRN